MISNQSKERKVWLEKINIQNKVLVGMQMGDKSSESGSFSSKSSTEEVVSPQKKKKVMRNQDKKMISNILNQKSVKSMSFANKWQALKNNMNIIWKLKQTPFESLRGEIESKISKSRWPLSANS